MEYGRIQECCVGFHSPYLHCSKKHSHGDEGQCVERVWYGEVSEPQDATACHALYR